MVHPDRNLDLLVRKYKERDEHGRLQSIWLNSEALTTRDNKGETPLNIARRSGACAEIIGLLSLTPEAAR